MPDAMDQVQDFNDAHVADSLKRHASRPREIGRTQCERLDCREPIAAVRTVLGAQLCEECQEEEDKRNIHFATWRQR